MSVLFSNSSGLSRYLHFFSFGEIVYKVFRHLSRITKVSEVKCVRNLCVSKTTQTIFVILYYFCVTHYFKDYSQALFKVSFYACHLNDSAHISFRCTVRQQPVCVGDHKKMFFMLFSRIIHRVIQRPRLGRGLFIILLLCTSFTRQRSHCFLIVFGIDLTCLASHSFEH